MLVSTIYDSYLHVFSVNHFRAISITNIHAEINLFYLFFFGQPVNRGSEFFSVLSFISAYMYVSTITAW